MKLISTDSTRVSEFFAEISKALAIFPQWQVCSWTVGPVQYQFAKVSMFLAYS